MQKWGAAPIVEDIFSCAILHTNHFLASVAFKGRVGFLLEYQMQYALQKKEVHTVYV